MNRNTGSTNNFQATAGCEKRLSTIAIIMLWAGDKTLGSSGYQIVTRWLYISQY